MSVSPQMPRTKPCDYRTVLLAFIFHFLYQSFKYGLLSKILKGNVLGCASPDTILPSNLTRQARDTFVYLLQSILEIRNEALERVLRNSEGLGATNKSVWEEMKVTIKLP